MTTQTPLKILIVTQYFWPENMRINDLVADFVAKGHEVTVLTGQPNYPEGKIFPAFKKNKESYGDYQGAKIIRVPMFSRGSGGFKLILNYISYFLSASTIGLFKTKFISYDAVFVYAVSPITAAIPAIILGRIKSIPVYLWVLDLWPETLAAVGATQNPFILKSMGRVVSWIYNRADYILMQSKSFKSNIQGYCTRPISEDRLVYFPNWGDDLIAQETHIKEHALLKRDSSYFTLLFAGNIAESQDFPTLLKALELLKEDPTIRLVIVGDGLMAPWVHKQIKERNLNNIIMLGRHPLSDMPAFFASADALLVSLKKNDIFSKTIPGKLQAYLASGMPVLGAIDGEAAAAIGEAQAGLVAPSGDATALAQIIKQMAALSPEQRQLMGKNGKNYYQSHFQATKLFGRLEQLFVEGAVR